MKPGGEIIVKNWLKLFLLSGLVLTLGACTTAQDQRELGEADRPIEQREITQDIEQTYETEQQETVEERPVAERPATQPAAPQGTQRATSQEDNLMNLRPGQSVGYYVSEFTRQGYDVERATRFSDRSVYELNKGNQHYRVNLAHDENNQVNRYEIRPIQVTSGATATNDQTFLNVQKQIRDIIKPGKQPVTYIPQLQKVGNVTQYTKMGPDATIQLEANNRQYVIQMDLNPNNGQVQTVQVEPSYRGV
jgi:hypothetical protein